uniref:Uncharacterized protein n=1 Tax=Romanomermis culicivorax TaxID=13658 RepID=A0A915HSZ5_ROMCU
MALLVGARKSLSYFDMNDIAYTQLLLLCYCFLRHKNHFIGWLQGIVDDEKLAFCKICSAKLKAHDKSLLDHTKTAKYVEQCKIDKTIGSTQQTFNVIRSNDNGTKANELHLSACIAEHTSIRSANHIGQLSATCSHAMSCQAKNIKLHQTKSSMIIKNVLAPAFKSELIADMGNSAYSLLIDESMDVGTLKMLGINENHRTHKRQ